jgi:NAD(P)-dependent dehydrogenase (short-subunit alcohol dehydrogenase family)
MKQPNWHGATALITGGGSGIGRALAIALSKRGATVIVTDIDAAAAASVAEECGRHAQALQLDVTDAAAVSQCVNTAFQQHGKLDYLFNNAGIGVGGEAHEIPVQAWDRIIDINIRGVTNGVLAAYPLMVAQGSGHIINTASLAGLGPAPLMSPYAMTKHAVVGLSNSLRIEARRYGVKVSALCPAAIETPILDKGQPADLPETPWVPDVRRFLTRLAGPPYPVEALAEETLQAIAQNKATIVIPGRARLAWRLGRFFPALVAKLSHDATMAERAHRATVPAE